MPPANGPAAAAADESAKVAASLQAPKWLIGTIVALLLGGGGMAAYTGAKVSTAPTAEQAEAIATKQARSVAGDVLTAHQRWLDERLAGIERQLDTAAKSADKRADGMDRRMDVLEGEVRQLRDRLILDLQAIPTPTRRGGR